MPSALKNRLVAVWLDRALVGSLFVLAVCAPLSIAATQVAWACGLLLWAARYGVRPRPKLDRTPVDYALLGFFILTFVSALFSYDADESIGKLRGASLFTIVYLVAANVSSRRVLRALALSLIASCMLSVVYTFGERAVGRGVKVEGLTADSPLRAVDIRDGDTLLEVDGAPLGSPEELDRALTSEGAGPVRVRLYRFELTPTVELQRGRVLAGDNPLARLGVTSWSRGRDWRASGFYGHYVTYAEVLQLIASLTLGLVVALWRRRKSWAAASLAASVAAMFVALMMTVTRASGLAFLLSACVIVLVGVANRRAVLAMAVAALLVVPVGLYVLQQKRNVGFFDRNDNSITWRETVYREGFNLLVREPRHLLVGVGADSIKRHWREWGLFDEGRLPVGHFHSTPLQLAVERGLPTLFLWLALLAVYMRVLWGLLARGGPEEESGDWAGRGIALGALGGLIGFFASGMVHYN
ncbi:MAG: O-antigen ligase family protein, partial [Acidobacteria bacterium]|nr:O-antigen ligase family protein [Acidobacteriota bacterium]